ncbi:Nucleoside phosphorylase [Flavobacterium aquidurense]|uniref:Nucleoside phosphorylase domain-containing protein n=1 Tax=Flavobacterium frigidimaris TaxID=262320 RepID=A0ABX4BRA3_FLAFR|nr:5'-methylthioadenosine/S-adenosylhomocysteine nucleosidase [Flavobacterium frigidimaris]OXA79061.1 hypothetical protein B0A65_10960 [Flavobacterium frigidimaris]SDY80500.1 Nucleoside phosphorylase [Flavobacterium aquidurense]
MKTVVVLTALEVERAEVLKYISSKETIFHPTTGTDYIKGKYKLANEIEIDIVICRTDQTNVNAALETERALEFFKPDYIFFVGVAGGLKDVSVGDIVIGTTVIGYERGKAEDENFKARPQFGASSYDLDRLASAYSISDEWKTLARSLNDLSFQTEIKVLTGTIASGEKVDASIKSSLHQHIKQNASHALAIEMEGLGFLEVCRARPLTKSLLLRGISDLVEDKEVMDNKGSQPYASKNVSAFLFGLLEILPLSTDKSLETSNEGKDKLKDQVIEVMCKLYPAGLRENGIWENAGGNLALINLSQSGKGQWVEATRVIFRGGGGSITAKSLLQAVTLDFSNNQDIITLINKL